MSRYCLDTVAYSHFKRGEAKIPASWIAPIGSEFLSSRSVSCALALPKDRGRKELDELGEFLAVPLVETLPVDL